MSRGTRKVRRHTSSQLIRETSGWMRAWTSPARPPPHRRGRILQGRGQGNSLHPQYYGASPLFIVSQDRHPPHIQKKTLTVSGRFGSLLLIGLPYFLRWRTYWMQPARHAPVVQYSMPTTANHMRDIWCRHTSNKCEGSIWSPIIFIISESSSN
jgi:hypothetical protein